MSGLVTADDLDFTAIDYFDLSTDSWDPVDPPNDPNVWNGGVMSAASPGLSAVFSFTGSQVSVFGRVQPTNGSARPVSLFAVGAMKQPQVFVPDEVTAAVDNVLFFNSTSMPYGPYKLVINVTQASTNAPFLLDYFQFNTTDPATGVSAESSSTSTSTSTTSTSSASNTANPDSGSTQGSSSTPVGAIVGGVIGGLAVVAAAIFGLCFYRIRSRQRARAYTTADPSAHISPTSITPYVVPGHANSQHFSEAPTHPGVPPSMRQLGSTYSLTSTAPAAAGALSEKSAAHRSQRTLAAAPAPRPTEKRSHSRSPSPGPASAYGNGNGSGSGRASAYDPAGPLSAASAYTGGSLSNSHSHSHTHTPSHSHSGSRPGTPTHSQHSSAAPARRAHAKGTRSETTGLLSPPRSPPPPPAGPAPQDSGMRFQPGLTPSDVAPVLPAGVAPLRQAATESEVARADIPPAYTAD